MPNKVSRFVYTRSCPIQTEPSETTRAKMRIIGPADHVPRSVLFIAFNFKTEGGSIIRNGRQFCESTGPYFIRLVQSVHEKRHALVTSSQKNLAIVRCVKTKHPNFLKTYQHFNNILETAVREFPKSYKWSMKISSKMVFPGTKLSSLSKPTPFKQQPCEHQISPTGI